MPSWFSTSLINQARGSASNNRRPSAIPLSTPQSTEEEESEYEEIKHPSYYSNMNSSTGHNLEDEATCGLCGSTNPLVVCEMCNHQLFCASCNDMFHRHPQRHNHRRKLLGSIQSHPLQPLSNIHHFQPPQMESPVPPPRRHKKLGLRSANASPTSFQRFPLDPMGSLRRFVGKDNGHSMLQRPLPMPPQNRRNEQFTKQTNPPPRTLMHPSPVGNHGSWDRRQSAPFPPTPNAKIINNFQNRSGSISSPGFHGRSSRNGGESCIPLTVMELERNRRQQSVVKGPDKYCLPPSRDSGWDEEEEEILPRSQRAFSVSACNLHQFPTSASDPSHFATLQRRGSTKPPARPPPPVPPRDFSQSKSIHPATSAFELNRKTKGAFVPIMTPRQNEFQSQLMSRQGHQYPEDMRSTLQRNQACLEQAMSLVELNLKDLSRLEQEMQPAYGNQPEMTRPNTRQGQHWSASHQAIRSMTPRLKSPLLPPSTTVQPEPVYYSGDGGDTFKAEVPELPDLDNLTDGPEGPWTCEHCTFINSKSTKVCTICCKTPVKGYQILQAAPPSPKSNKNSRLGSKSKSVEPDQTPVIQSALTFSIAKSPPGQKIFVQDVDKAARKHATKQVMAAYDSRDESDSDSSSSDEITEKHRSFVRDSKSNTLKKGKMGDERATSFQAPIGQVAKKETKMVDSGTGDYSILDPEVVGENRSRQYNSDQGSFHQSKVFSVTNEKENKSSKGTSPPPQTISTQTYEELPAETVKSPKSVSKMSLQSSAMSQEMSPPREMPEKALRYARRAQQQSQLKRSMSTHLTSASTGTNDTWTGHGQYPRQHHEGRHLYRTSSRQSLASDTRSLPISGPPSRDVSPPPSRKFEDFGRINRFGQMSPWERFPCPADYFASIDDMVGRRRRDSEKSHEIELSRLLKEAEELNFTPEDLQVGLRMCGSDRNPIKWLEENWSNMIETIQTLATKFGRDKGQDFNEVGTISALEAKEALRMHKGNVWAAVTECVEQRRRKFLELQSRGTFLREDILTALTANKGNLDAAYVELSKNQLKPFLMRIWGPPSGKDNESAPPPRFHLPLSLQHGFPPELKTDTQLSSESASENLPSQNLTQSIVVQLNSSFSESQNISPPSSSIPEVDAVASNDDSLAKAEEEEMFYDPEPPTTNLFIANGELNIDDSEAQVSAFIQNYQVPARSPSPAPSSPVSDFQDAQPISIETKQLSSKVYDSPETPSLEEKLTVSEMESLLGNDTSASSSQAIVALSRTLNLIAEKLGVVLKPQQTAEGELSGIKAVLENVALAEEKVKESKEMEEEVKTSESMLRSPIRKEEVQTLQEIYAGDLNLLKEIVMSGNENVTKCHQAQPTFENSILTSSKIQIQPEKVYESFVVNENKSASSKIYDVLESLAGTFLRKSTKTKQPAQPDENLYETVAVYKGTHIEAFVKPEPLPTMPEEKFQSFNLNQLLSDTGNQETNFDVSRISTSTNMSVESQMFNLEEVDTNGIQEVEHEILDDFSGGESSDGEAEIENTGDLDEYMSEDDSIEEDALDAKWSEVAYALNQATLQDSVANTRINAAAVELFQSGKVSSLEKAELACKLIDMNFSESDSIHAANECSSLYTAISFLQQECQLCTGKFSAKQMISMLRCKHACCRTCAMEYFMVQIRDQSILGTTCPFCKEPSNLAEDADQASDYFSHLDILLKDLLDENFYEMFGRKLRDWTLVQTPNFKWCSKCSSGFIIEPLQTHLICPDCNTVTCAICLNPWDKFNHEHRDQVHSLLFCDESAKSMPKSILDYLNENSIECPKCHLKFALARGGCMHMTCSQCRYEFCSGCSAPFAMGLRCKENASYCSKLGLHAHHPRNCLFYLRDKEPELLMKLLTDSKVTLVSNTHKPESEEAVPNPKCIVALQKETPEGLVDEICGHVVSPGCSEICQTHFTEYLSLLVYENRLDPIPILTNDDLETIVKRACKRMPPRSYGTADADYRPLLLKVIEEEIPL